MEKRQSLGPFLFHFTPDATTTIALIDLNQKMAASQASHKLLPVANPTPSYWRSELHHLDSHRSTPDLPKESQIVIIGAGIAGVSVACGTQSKRRSKASFISSV